ncbi:hypothetical protein C8R43DRAFT_1240018 [Mycena crocata]|nr:hypothetical protein C8R43DRAFT_1240018 [Mycena crocata]
MSFSPTYLWDPRAQSFADDKLLFSQPPIAPIFAANQTKRESSRLLDLLVEVLLPELSTPNWVAISTDWVLFCLGGEIVSALSNSEDAIQSFNTQIQLFVHVLWLRYIHGDTEQGEALVHKCLLDGRVNIVRFLSAPPQQLSFIEDISRQDRLVDFDDEEEYDDEASSLSGSDDVYDDDEDPVYDDAEDSDEDSDYLSEENEGKSNVYRWQKNISAFFYPQEIQLTKPRECKRVVKDLVQMRNLPAQVYESPEFTNELKDSGLLDLFLKICQPGNLLETTHPDVELSYRFYNWLVSYGELLCRWTPPLRLEPLNISSKIPYRPFDPIDFLMFFSQNRRMHPWRSNPMAAYLFVSCSAFKVNCRLWLIPSLETLGFGASGWDLDQVYRDLMRHPVMQNRPEYQLFLAGLDAKLRTVITETAALRKQLEDVDQELYYTSPSAVASNSTPGPSSSLHKLIEHPPSTSTARRAQRVLGVAPTKQKPPAKQKLTDTQRKNAKNRVKAKARRHSAKDNLPTTVQAANTSQNLNDGDRLKPLGKKQKNKKKKSRIYKRRYISPLELKLQWVEARPADHAVWTDCGRDIVRFIHIVDGEEYMVGGVRFNALSAKTLRVMQDNHRLVRVRGLKRRDEIDEWAYGTMTGSGSRLPIGGKLGDGYAPYARHSGGSVEDIKALFRHAMDTDILIMAAKTIYPDLEHDLLHITEESELNRFGRFGITGFYCTNFISCLHRDQDMVNTGRSTLHPCIQLSKENCGPDDYNFGMVEWGLAIRTQENAVWVFNGRDVHGTIMPSQTAMDNGAASKGKHDTNNEKNVDRATTIHADNARVRNCSQLFCGTKSNRELTIEAALSRLSLGVITLLTIYKYSGDYAYTAAGDSASPFFRNSHPVLHARLFFARAQAEIRTRGLDTCNGQLGTRMVDGYLDAALPYCEPASNAVDASITCFPLSVARATSRTPQAGAATSPGVGCSRASAASPTPDPAQGGWGGLGVEFQEADAQEKQCGEMVKHPVLFVPRQDRWNPFHVGEDLVTTFLALTLFSRHAAASESSSWSSSASKAIWSGLATAYTKYASSGTTEAHVDSFAQLTSQLETELRATAGLQLVFQDEYLPTQSLFAPLYDRIGAWAPRRTAAEAR